ncbi:hypothetical protein ACN47E_000781 [Coniothyrium glycines]
MDLVGQINIVAQRAAGLEKLFFAGNEDQALKAWEDHASLEPEHLEIGVKLHALAGNTDYAFELMEELYKRRPKWPTDVMMHVFRALTTSARKKHHKAASRLYMKMKELKGCQVNLSDYDAWFVGFLEAGDFSRSKQVFMHMVQEGHVQVDDSVDAIEQILERLHMLSRLGTDISRTTSIALSAMSVLPPAYHGYIYGDWLKSCVVFKTPEAAAQIIDMMIRRGLEPGTFHFNMLLKALLRTQDTPNILKAENIGWRMIAEARKLRKKKNSTLFRAAKYISKKMTIPIKDLNNITHTPPADIDTFALIMHHHGKYEQWEHVDYLARQLQNLELKPNTTILNVLIDNQTRKGAFAEAWALYERITAHAKGQTGVYPNGASLRHLWKALRLALGSSTTRHDPNLPTPRHLLQETLSWWTLCKARPDARRFLQGLSGSDNEALTPLILHCFSYTSDLAGTLVALHVLSSQFRLPTPAKAKDILVRHLAWVDLSRETQAVATQHFHGRSNVRNTIRLNAIYNMLLRARVKRMRERGDLPRKHPMTRRELAEIELNLLSEFIRVVLRRQNSPEQVEDIITRAKREVGLPRMATGDLYAWEVP